mmetsp:Transcript_11238/g.22087  ORF Transcript_11238/g.22087 Transcript_11238/m.22087 type:complete len:329 (-) Transcript_11238:125-1111(-)
MSNRAEKHHRRYYEEFKSRAYEDIEIVPLPVMPLSRSDDSLLRDPSLCVRVQTHTGTTRVPESVVSALVTFKHHDECAGKMTHSHRHKRKPMDEYDPLVQRSDIVFHRLRADVVRRVQANSSRTQLRRRVTPLTPVGEDVQIETVEMGIGRLYATLFSNDNKTASLGVHEVIVNEKWQRRGIGKRLMERLLNKFPATSVVMRLNSTQVAAWRLFRSAAISTGRRLSIGHTSGAEDDWSDIRTDIADFPRPADVFLPRNCEYSLTLRLEPAGLARAKRARMVPAPDIVVYQANISKMSFHPGEPAKKKVAVTGRRSTTSTTGIKELVVD